MSTYRNIERAWAAAVQRGDVGERRVQEWAAAAAGLPQIADAMARLSDEAARSLAERTKQD